MEMREGSCRLGLWHVHVYWEGSTVSRVRFSRTPLPGPVPVQFRRYCAGKREDFAGLTSIALSHEYPYSAIYSEVRKIPYGETRTYGQVGSALHVSPRLVGLAMKRNPTPLIIPCHRVVSRNGIGGFSPDPDLKEVLLSLEQKNKRVLSR